MVSDTGLLSIIVALTPLPYRELLSMYTCYDNGQRKGPLVGPSTPFSLRREPVPIHESCVMYCIRPTRALPARSNRNVASTSKSFHRAPSVIRACRRSLWEVCCCEMVLQSPSSCPVLGKRMCLVCVSECDLKWSLFSAF